MIPKISKEEFKNRIQNFKKQMERDNIDLVVGFSNLLDPSCVRYFSDFSAVNESSAILIPLNGKPILCAGQAGLDYAQIKNKLDDACIRVFPEVGEVSGFEYSYEGQIEFSQIFKELKERYSIKKIGYIGRLIFPAVIFEKMKSVFSDSKILCYDEKFYTIRLIKTSSEIKCIKHVSEIISETFFQSVPLIKEGLTELEIQAILESKMLELGAESYVQSFAPMVATGMVRSNISMCRNSNRKVVKSEIINLAAGACYEGYNGIICTPYILGDIPVKISDAIKCAYDALKETVYKIKPGVGSKEVLDTYTNYLNSKNYLKYCPYGSLHSTGLLECEAPTFTVKNNRELQENMTICIDSYFKGLPWGSFRIEDVYHITKNSCQKLTSYNDKQIPILLSKNKGN